MHFNFFYKENKDFIPTPFIIRCAFYRILWVGFFFLFILFSCNADWIYCRTYLYRKFAWAILLFLFLYKKKFVGCIQCMYNLHLSIRMLYTYIINTKIVHSVITLTLHLFDNLFLFSRFVNALKIHARSPYNSNWFFMANL